jgi:hypothetical protein
VANLFILLPRSVLSHIRSLGITFYLILIYYLYQRPRMANNNALLSLKRTSSACFHKGAGTQLAVALDQNDDAERGDQFGPSPIEPTRNIIQAGCRMPSILSNTIELVCTEFINIIVQDGTLDDSEEFDLRLRPVCRLSQPTAG